MKILSVEMAFNHPNLLNSVTQQAIEYSLIVSLTGTFKESYRLPAQENIKIQCTISTKVSRLS